MHVRGRVHVHGSAWVVVSGRVVVQVRAWLLWGVDWSGGARVRVQEGWLE